MGALPGSTMRAPALGAGYTQAPPVTETEWQLQGLCNREDPELFYPEGHTREIKLRARAAINVCSECPVLAQCREWALSHQEIYGIWGGLTEQDREFLRTGRRRYTRRTA